MESHRGPRPTEAPNVEVLHAVLAVDEMLGGALGEEDPRSTRVPDGGESLHVFVVQFEKSSQVGARDRT